MTGCYAASAKGFVGCSPSSESIASSGLSCAKRNPCARSHPSARAQTGLLHHFHGFAGEAHADDTGRRDKLPASTRSGHGRCSVRTLALVGAFLFLFAFGGPLLRSRTFASLAEPTPPYRGFVGSGWWIAALITTAGPLLYLWVWQSIGLGGGFLAPNELWPQNFTNVYMGWAAIVGLIATALIWVNHRFFTARLGGTGVHTV